MANKRYDNNKRWRIRDTIIRELDRPVCCCHCHQQTAVLSTQYWTRTGLKSKLQAVSVTLCCFCEGIPEYRDAAVDIAER